MDIPPPDPAKLLAAWMEWERGDATPGRVMANLKTAGMRELLETLVSRSASPDLSDPASEADPASWKPVV